MSQSGFFPNDDVLHRLVTDLQAVPPATLDRPIRWREAAAQPSLPGARRTVRARVALAATTVIAACGLAAAVVLGALGTESASALPALDSEAVDATGLRENARLLDRAKASFDHAHAIDTPYGTGYVMTAADGKLCLAVPDVPGAGYGQACAPRAQVEARGLHIALISPTRAVAVAVVPADTRAAALRTANGDEQPLAVKDGVVAVSTTNGDAMTYRTDQDMTTISLRRREGCFIAPRGATISKRRSLQSAMGLPPCPPADVVAK